MSCSMYNTAAAAGDSDPLLRQKPKAVRWHLFALAGRVDVCNSELSPDFLGLVSPLNWINPGRGKAFRSCSLELFHFLLWLVVHAFLSFYALIHSHSAALKLNRLFVFAAANVDSGPAGVTATDILSCPESIFYSLQQEFPMMPWGSCGVNNACVTCCLPRWCILRWQCCITQWNLNKNTIVNGALQSEKKLKGSGVIRILNSRSKDLNLFFTVFYNSPTVRGWSGQANMEQKTPAEYLIMQSSTACPA